MTGIAIITAHQVRPMTNGIISCERDGNGISITNSTKSVTLNNASD